MRLNNKIEERRKYLRCETTLPLEIKTDGLNIATSTKNISCAGAYCQVNKYLAPMTKLKIAMVLNGPKKNTTIRCNGVVVRAEPALISKEAQKYNIAIFFNDIAEAEKEKINSFIKAA